MNYNINELKSYGVKGKAKTILILLFGTVITFLLPYLIHNSQEPKNIKELRCEINQIKNTVTKEQLLNCKIETRNCDFNITNADLNELTECFKNSRPVQPIRNTSSASVTFMEENKEKHYEIEIRFYNPYVSRGVAVMYIRLYKQNKSIASDEFSCPELIDWSIKNFPKVFEAIQKENDSHFYR